MNPPLFEITATILLAIIAFALWRSLQPRKRNDRLPNGQRREVWDEVEGKVTSLAVRGEAVFIGYEFLTPHGSHHAEHRFPLEVAEPYQFGSREADLAQAADRFLRAYPVGRSARVRYNPKRVAESVLARPRAQAIPAPAKVAETSPAAV